MKVKVFRTICFLLIFSFPFLNRLIGVDSHGRSTNPVDNLKFQQSHLRPIDHRELLVMPSRRPLPPGIHAGSPFGMRFHPILHRHKMHAGVDFGAPKGTPVLATAPGVVVRAEFGGKKSTYGKVIEIDHLASDYLEGTYSTLYAHLSRVLVRPGQVVAAGDTIGLVGSTGRSTSPHLHYEVRHNGQEVDPAGYFKLLDGDRHMKLNAIVYED